MPCARSRESISGVPMSLGALTETTLFLSWPTVLNTVRHMSNGMTCPNRSSLCYLYHSK